jgi:hypothetical protein
MTGWTSAVSAQKKKREMPKAGSRSLLQILFINYFHQITMALKSEKVRDRVIGQQEVSGTAGNQDGIALWPN